MVWYNLQQPPEKDKKTIQRNIFYFVISTWIEILRSFLVKWYVLSNLPIIVILVGFHQSIFTPFSENDLIFTVLHDPNSFTLVLAELAVVYIFFGIPLQSESVLAAFVQDVVLPASEVDLAWEVPDHCEVACDYYHTVGVFFKTDLLSWSLEVLEDFLGLMEELLLALLPWEERIWEYLWYFDGNVLDLSLGRKANLFNFCERSSIWNLLDKLSRRFFYYLLPPFLLVDDIDFGKVFEVWYLLLLGGRFSQAFWLWANLFQ